MATEKPQRLIGPSEDVTHLDGPGVPQYKPTQVPFLGRREQIHGRASGPPLIKSQLLDSKCPPHPQQVVWCITRRQ